VQVNTKENSLGLGGKPIFLTVAVIVAAITCLWAVAFATGDKKVAVLELVNKAGITDDEASYLTDKVRDIASRTLAKRGFLIITRESLQELLPPGTDLSKCTDAQCEVEIGRTIGADYIVTGEIIKYAGDFLINLKVHHSQSGAFLGSQSAEGADKKALKNSIDRSSFQLFNKVLAHSGVSPVSPTQPSIQPGTIGESSTGEWDMPTGSQVVVRFESDPLGAVVLVDGQLKCQQTPCSKAINEGSATISMQRERYQARQEIVAVKKGMAPVSWKLSPNFGWLTLESSPSGLAIKINGEAAGTTPIRDKELDPGNYEVLVSDPRYYDKGERFSLSVGERKTISAVLLPREGGVEVTARDQSGNDLAGDIYLDGTKVGVAPGTFKMIIGQHQIEVRTSQGSWSDTVEVKERNVAKIIAELEAVSPEPDRLPSNLSSYIYGKQKIYAIFNTNYGTFTVELFKDRTPKTVDNFVGLATGEKMYKDPKTGQMTKGKYYDGLTFHRVIPQFMIQGGCPVGNGTGGPGYKFADEFQRGLRHDKAGILSMANSGLNTNGSQFFITLKATPWLDNRHTVFGEVVQGMTVINKIAKVRRDNRDKPIEPVVIKTLEIREGK
jgi:peptidyl-prolyl cis-trans isomerase A (cyclophilin A)